MNTWMIYIFLLELNAMVLWFGNPNSSWTLRSRCLGTWRRWFGFSVHSAVVYQRIRLQPRRLKQHLMLSLGRDLGCRRITFFFLGFWNTHIFYGLSLLLEVPVGNLWWFRSTHFYKDFLLFVQIQNIYFDYWSSHHGNTAFLVDDPILECFFT